MTDLTVTNAYSKGNARTPLKINGNVEIANFKPEEEKPTAFVQAKVTDGNVSIHSNKGNVQSLDFSNEKYSVMLKIANSSKDDSGAGELSWYDLRDTDKAKLGLDDSFVVKKDLNAGILNIYKKVGDKLTTWLHINFETKAEKSGNQTNVAKPTNTAKTTSNNSTWKMPATVDEECLKHLDPDGNGKFELNNDDENPTLPFNICSIYFSNDKYVDVDKEVMNEMKALNGQKITPEFIDKLINKILDMADKNSKEYPWHNLGNLTEEGEDCMSTYHPLADICKFAQYLKPATVDRLLKSGSVIYYNWIDKGNDYQQYYKNIENLYSRLSDKQKELYYQNVLDTSYNTHGTVFGTWQANGNNVAKLIYEKPLSSNTYAKLKNLVTTMNESGNGIASSKTESKALITALLTKHQITLQQANELLKAGKIQ